MKTPRWLVCVVGLALGALFLASPLAVYSSGDPADKPVILEFGRRLCPVCLKNALVLKDVEATYQDQINLRFLYIDTDGPLFHDYGITFVPTQVFLDASGREVDRHEGPISKEELIARLKKLNFVRE